MTTGWAIFMALILIAFAIGFFVAGYLVGDETARYSLADLDRMLPALPPRPQPVVLPRPQFAAPSMAGHAGLAERIGDIWNRMVPADVLLQERGLVPVNAAGYWQFPGAAPDERFRYRTFADGSVQCFGSRAAAVFGLHKDANVTSFALLAFAFCDGDFSKAAKVAALSGCDAALAVRWAAQSTGRLEEAMKELAASCGLQRSSRPADASTNGAK